MTEIEIDLQGIDAKDMNKFALLNKEREKIIHDSSLDAIHTEFNTNVIAQKLHPKEQWVKVSEIILETEDTKSFVLVPDTESGTKELAYFKAGQYISVEVKIDGGVYHRPYTLSCSPKQAFDNKYKITIKKVPNGIVSNYFFDLVQVGDTFSISAPVGEFTYERLRDANHILAIAGGSGITPIMSITEAIYDDIIDATISILYGTKTVQDILFKKRLDELASKSKKIKIEYILSEEKNESFMHGLITKDLMDTYLEEENSFFLCGPVPMYSYMNEILKEYNIAKKYIRHDLFRSDINNLRQERYSLTVLTHEKSIEIPCYGDETLLSTMEKNGILAPSKCYVGECGFCKSKLISGKVKTFDGDMRLKDKNYNYIHPCTAYPESDIVLKLPK